ncbi:hypothetical protein [Legionella parisiensis]|uniref:Uncharacterized protein n=1 Tax=Legionella parisiensis TaxID=45071 RepID=A0A1E5JTB3_9GAMM|nr:hypothetical protein [Legionella parisiensis]KTD40588.1 hypothetical protein Lpar_1905 [Legionella parisiensis]OEH47766.1 hypothetical protein lpari_01231 [Legionella parisiensis]STX77019.1 Uncharacterised protein [Legionella parisiensis]
MPKVRGPKDGTFVTASFDSVNKRDNSKSRFPSLKTTKDLVLLSIVGNEFCAGDYLSAIVQQSVVTHQTPVEHTGPKGKTTFLIADEIYWHNLKGKTTTPGEEEALKNKALEKGEKYFESNLIAFLAPLGMSVDEFELKYPKASMNEKISIINQLALEQGKNFEIVRWHTWIAQNDFNKTLKDIIPYYERVEGLRDAIEDAVIDFVKRHSKDGGDRETWTERSRGYLTEESPSIMLLAAQLGYNFIIYPGTILPPFSATKEYFIVDNHVARIEKGHSIKDECTHNEFCLHTENPSRLVNWLEVNFTRSHVAPKSREVPKPRDVTTPSKVSETQEVPKPPEGGEVPVGVKLPGVGSTTLEEVTKSKALTFFDQRRSTVVPPRKVNRLLITEITDEDGRVLQVVPKTEDIISSIVQGISYALENHIPGQTGKSEKRIQTPLTHVFEGIAKGVLEAEHLSMTDKVEFLTELVNSYVNRLVHEERENAPSRMSMII